MERLTAVQFGVVSFYLYIGGIVGSWVTRVPRVKDDNNMSDGLFGICLIFTAIGGIAALPVAAYAAQKYGSANVCLIGAIWSSSTLPLIGLNYGVVSMIPVMLALGVGIATVDLAINIHAAVLERYVSKPWMGRMFAINSMGAFAGSLIGGVFCEYGISPLVHFSYVSAFLLPLAVVSYMFLFSKKEESDIPEESPLSSNYVETGVGSVLVIGSTDAQERAKNNWGKMFVFINALCMLASIGAGGVTDWSTVYLTKNLEASELVASVGFAIFAICLAIGRFLTDYFTVRYHKLVLIRVGGSVGGLGLAIACAAPSLPGSHQSIQMAMAGLALCGLGLGVVYPSLISSASKMPGFSPNQGISSVSGIAYAAFLVGPSIIGGVSYLTGDLKWALVLLACLLFLIALLPGKLPDGSGYLILNERLSNPPFDTAAEDVISSLKTGAIFAHGLDDS
jgi:MFS family permease